MTMSPAMRAMLDNAARKHRSKPLPVYGYTAFLDHYTLDDGTEVASIFIDDDAEGIRLSDEDSLFGVAEMVRLAAQDPEKGLVLADYLTAAYSAPGRCRSVLGPVATASDAD